MSKVLVTGAGGYIGTQLIQDLLDRNHQVVALDRYFFGMEPISKFINNKNFEIVKQDIRDVTEKNFVGVDIVCDLACLSNDPSGEMNPELTYQINRDGRIHVAKMAKKSGVKKYLISSSCSVYGLGEDEHLTENSNTNPISVYAKSTLQAEQATLELNTDDFSVTALRNATVFGLSKRMRFDLVVNLMTLTAFKKGQIFVMGGGMQWRPLVHVSDVSRAFISIFESNKSAGKIYNVGLTNIQIKSLAYLIRDEIKTPISIEFAPDDADKRNYNVSFDRLKYELDFECSTEISFGIREIYKALMEGKVDSGQKTVTVQWYKNILEAQELIESIKLNDRII